MINSLSDKGTGSRRIGHSSRTCEPGSQKIFGKHTSQSHKKGRRQCANLHMILPGHLAPPWGDYGATNDEPRFI